MMDVRQVETSRAWHWVMDGWALFRKNPRDWIFMTLAYLVIALGLDFIPWIGSLVFALLAPALTGGMLYGADQLARGGQLDLSHLIQAFRIRSLTHLMFMLGAISLVGGLLLGLVGGGLVTGSVLGGILRGPATHLGSLFVGTGMLSLVALLLMSATLVCLLFYAVPLVMLSRLSPVDAIGLSLTACLRNWRPLGVLGLVSLGLAMAALLTLGLGWLVLTPVLVGALYSSYRDLFGAEPVRLDKF